MVNLTVAGIAEFAEDEPLYGMALFAIGNIIGTSIVPVPVGVFFCVLAGLMFGAVGGLVAYVATCATGAWITFLLTRLLRPHIIANLGEYATTWEKINGAIMREGIVICVLWRIAPIAPFVLSSVLISLTTITQFQYVWTTTLGIIPSTVPIVSAAALGRNLATGEADRLQIAFNVISILAGAYVMYRLARIAQAIMARDAPDAPVSSEKDMEQLRYIMSRVEQLRAKYGDIGAGPMLL